MPDEDASKSDMGSRLPSEQEDDSDGMDGDSGMNKPPGKFILYILVYP